jgi:predicted deacylase
VLLALPVRATVSGYPCFKTVDELYAEMTNIVSSYPSLARLTNVGTTKLGEQMLGIVITGTNSETKYPVMLTAGVHPDEISPSDFLLVLAREACASYATNGYSYRYILNFNEIHIIPIVGIDTRRLVDANGDGGPSNRNLYRTNNGVNLNRNFPTTWHWGTNGVQYSDDPTSLSYAGIGPASEPEVAAITNYMHQIFTDVRDDDEIDAAPLDASGLFIDIHTEAQTVNYWRGVTNATGPNEAQLLSLARKARHYTGYQINGDTGGASGASGSSGTASAEGYGHFGVPSFTWEFGEVGKVDCANYTSHVLPTNLPAFRYMLRVGGRRPYLEPKAPELTSLAVTVTTNGSTRELQITGSADDTRNDAAPDHNISQVRYAIGYPTWHASAVTNAATVTATATGKANFSATYDASALSPGEYVLYAAASDTSDTANYGVQSAALFTIDGEPVDPPDPPPTGSGQMRAAPGALRGTPSAWRMQ